MIEFLLGLVVGLFLHRLYWYILYKITPNLDWWTDKPKFYFWRFWK
tara:strand:+ start:3442 stop:3579 length:138 start_codon:yes stop_codon:yes gene_type:complete